MCNFVGMKQNLPDIIRGNEDLQQTLLAQEGGILKYLAEHMDADGIEALYEDYRTQCLNAFRDEHKWDMGEDEMVRGALDDNHIKKELAYQVALRPFFLRFPDVMDAAISFITKYLNFAFKKCHPEFYPNVIPDMEFYEGVVIQYGDRVFGKAHRCLWLVLNEYRGKAKAEKDEAELWTEFELQKYAQIYVAGKDKLRRAINELIIEKTQGKGKEECHQVCRKEAIDVMKRLKSFTRLVNGDDDIVSVFMGEGKDDEKPMPVECSMKWFVARLEYEGYNIHDDKIAKLIKSVKKNRIVISKEEMAWLRQDWLSKMHPADDKPLSPLHECFQSYYGVLEEIGNIWAAKLQEYGIDISKLEEETGCILDKRGFFVERSMGGLLGKVCVIEHEDDGVEAKRVAIMEYVGRLKEIVKDDYLSVYDEMWNMILSLESVKSKVYKKGRQKDTTFNRNLVANIIHLMKEHGIFKVGITEVFMARLLEPEDDGKEHEIKGRGENHPVKGALYNTVEDKTNKNDVEKVIMKYLKT